MAISLEKRSRTTGESGDRASSAANGESKSVEVQGTYQFKEMEGVQTFKCNDRPAVSLNADCASMGGTDPFC